MDERARGLAAGGLIGLVLLAGILASRSGMLGPVAAAPGEPANGGPSAAASVPPALGEEAIYRLFAEPGRALMGGSTVRTSVTKAGDLALPSGRIVADDVWFLGGGEPLAQRVPAGSYPVTLLLAGDALAEAVAAAMTRFAQGDPLRWEPAAVEGVDPASLDPDTFATYGVDSGTAAFAAAEAVERIDRDESLSEAYGDEMTRQLFPSPGEARESAVIVVDPASGANVIAFTSGSGDGGYAAWFGLDATGRPIVLLTSFDLLTR